MKESNDVEKLKGFKKDTGYTYAQLGKKLGVHYRTVYLWVSGKTKPSPMAKERIRKFLKKHYQG